MTVKTYDYDAFGNDRNALESDNNPFRYCGEYFDTATETYFLRARWYDPATGRFTQQDSWAYYDPNDQLSLNLYLYCYGNPVKYNDPSGNASVDLLDNQNQPDEDNDPEMPGGGGHNPNVQSSSQINVSNSTSISKSRVQQLPSKGGSLSATGAYAGGKGFSTFGKLKAHIGPLGKNFHWHHIVEQCQIGKSGFDATSIHNTGNVIPVSSEVHRKITGYYSRIPSDNTTGGLRFRDWLAGQDYQTQYAWGIKIFEQFSPK